MESRGYESAFMKAKATAKGISSRPRKKSLPIPTAPSNPPKKNELISTIQNPKPSMVSQKQEQQQEQQKKQKQQEREKIVVDNSKLSESEWQRVKTEALNMNKSNRKNFGFPSFSSSSLGQLKYKHKLINTLYGAMRNGKAVLDNTKLNAVDCAIQIIDSIRTEHINKVHILYLSNNNIATLDGIETYSNVETLSLANNQITYLHQLKALRYLSHLRKLAIVGNPIVEMPYFKQRLLLLCPNLQTLDGKAITRDDHNDATITASSATITTEQLMLNELRNTILLHVSKVTAMQTELLYEVCGRYAAIRGGDLPAASDGTDSSMDRSGTIIRRLLQGGCFYMLQIGCREHFDVMLQDLCRSASEILKRTSNSNQGVGNNNNRFYKRHWDNVYTQIMGNQHQEWMKLIQKTEQNRDQVLEFYSKGRIRAGAGAIVMNASNKQKQSSGSELNAAVHNSYNQVAAADAQQSLELIQFLRPNVGTTDTAAHDNPNLFFSTSLEDVDTTAANIIALENSQFSAASATGMSMLDANTSLDPVLQRLYAGVGSHSFMRRKNPSATMNKSNNNITNSFEENNILLATSQTAYSASVNVSTEAPKMKTESVFGSRVSTGRVPRGRESEALRTSNQLVNNVNANINVRKSTGSIFSPNYIDASASMNKTKMNVNTNKGSHGSSSSSGSGRGVRENYGFGLDDMPHNPVVSRSIDKYNRLVTNNTNTATISNNKNNNYNSNNSINKSDNILHFLEQGGGRDQEDHALEAAFGSDPVDTAHTSEDENPRYIAPPAPLTQPNPNLHTKSNNNTVINNNDLRHSHPAPSSSSSIWQRNLDVNVDPYTSNLPTPQLSDPYASEVITPPPTNTLFKGKGKSNGRNSNPFGSTDPSDVRQRNPFDETANDENNQNMKNNDDHSSKNIRPSLISGKGLNRSLEIRKSHENLNIALERGLILGRGKGDTTSASVELKSPSANVKVDLKGIRAFIAKVAADAQLLGFDPAELDQDGKSLKGKKNKKKVHKTEGGEVLDVIFEAEVDAGTNDSISDSDNEDKNDYKDTPSANDTLDGDTDAMLMQITDADIAAAHPWLRDVFFLGALPSDEDLMLPVASIKEEEDIKEVRTGVDLSQMNMKALQNRVHALVATVDKARSIWSASISKHLRIKRRADNIVSRMKKCSSKAYSRIVELKGDIHEVKVDCQKAADWIADTGSVLRAIDLERDKVSTMRDLLQVTVNQRSELIALLSQEEDKRMELEKACEEVASVMLGIDVEIENDRDLKRARAVTKIRTKAIVLTRYLTATKRWFLRRLRTRVRRQRKIKRWFERKQHQRHIRTYRTLFRGWIRYIVGERRLAVAFRWVRRQRTSNLFDKWLGSTRRCILVKAMHTRRVRQLGRLVLRVWFQYTTSSRSRRGRALRYIDADVDDDELNKNIDDGDDSIDNNDYNNDGSNLLTSYQMNSRRNRYRSLYMTLYEPKLSSFLLLRTFRGWKGFYEACCLIPRHFNEGCRLARRHYYSRFLRAWFVAAIKSKQKSYEQQQHLLHFRAESTVRVAWKSWHLYVKSKLWGSQRVLTRSMAKLAVHTVIQISMRRAMEIGRRFSLSFPKRCTLKQLKHQRDVVYLSRRRCRYAEKAHIRCISRKALLGWKQHYDNAQFDLKEESKAIIHYFGGMRRRVFNAWLDCVTNTMILRRKYLGYNTSDSNSNSHVRMVLAGTSVGSNDDVFVGTGATHAYERPPLHSKTMMHMYGSRIYSVSKQQQQQQHPLVGDDTDDDIAVENDGNIEDDENEVDGDDLMDMNLVETTRSKRRARLVKAMSFHRQHLVKLIGFSRLHRICHKRRRLKITALIVKQRSSNNRIVNLKNTMTVWKRRFSRKCHASLEVNHSLVEKNDKKDGSMDQNREAIVGRIGERNEEISELQKQVDELNHKLNEKDGQLKGVVLQINSTEGGNVSARTAIADAEQLTNIMQIESNTVMLMVGGGESLVVHSAKKTATTKSSKSLIIDDDNDDDEGKEDSETKSTDEKEHELRRMRDELDLTEKERNALFHQVESSYEIAVQTQTEAQRKLSDLRAQRQDAEQRQQRSVRMLADVNMSIEDLILQRKKVENILNTCKTAVITAAESEEEKTRQHHETLAAMNDEEKVLRRRREVALLELSNRQQDLETLRQEIINKRNQMQLQYDREITIPTNSLVLARDIVSATEMQYSQAERTLHALELDVAQAVSHTTSTISLNALTASERIAGVDVVSDTNALITSSMTNVRGVEVDAQTTVLDAVEKENRHLRAQRVQELIDSKSAVSSGFLRMAKEERLERNKNILDANASVGAALSSESGIDSSKKERKGSRSKSDSKKSTTTSEFNKIFTTLSRKKKDYNSSPSSGTNSGDNTPRDRSRSSRKISTKSKKEKGTRNKDKDISFTASIISGTGTAIGTLSDSSSGYEADIPSLDDLRTDKEINDITSRLLGET